MTASWLQHRSFLRYHPSTSIYLSLGADSLSLSSLFTTDADADTESHPTSHHGRHSPPRTGPGYVLIEVPYHGVAFPVVVRVLAHHLDIIHVLASNDP